MQAASAIPGVHALAGDPLAAPDGVAVDGFSQALAALMALLGPGLGATVTTPGANGGQTPSPGASLGAAALAAKPIAVDVLPGQPTAPAAGATVMQPLAAGLHQLRAGEFALASATLTPANLTPANLAPANPAPATADIAAAAAPAAQGAPLEQTTQYGQPPAIATPAGLEAAVAAGPTLAASPATGTPISLDPALARFVQGAATPATGRSPAPAAPLATAIAAASDASTGAPPPPDAGAPQAPPPALDAQAGSPTQPLSAAISLAPLTPASPFAQVTLAADRGRTGKADARAALTVTGAAKVAASVALADAPVAVSEVAAPDAGLAPAIDPLAKAQNPGDASGSQSPSAQSADPSSALAAADGAPTAAAAAPTAAAAMAAANGTQITAQLAAQIGRKADSRQGRFDFALEPQGLGRVDVSLKIDAAGQLSAMLSFDNPATAAEAKNRAGDLQSALQQAGFDVSHGSLSFTSGGSAGGHGQAAWEDASSSRPAWASGAIIDPAPSPPAVVTTPPPSRPGGLDIRI